jgi:hypothetical protein
MQAQLYRRSRMYVDWSIKQKDANACKAEKKELEQQVRIRVS